MSNKKKPGRKIIQIASDLNQGGLYSLCEDGTLWTYLTRNSSWIQLNSIPLPEESNEPDLSQSKATKKVK